jgi:signal transduction histidine kinase
MTLASTYQRFYLVLLGILLALGCVTYYLTIRYVLIHQVDNDLRVEQQEILDFARQHDSLPAPSHYRDQEMTWQTATVAPCPDSGSGRHGRNFQNTRTWNPRGREWEPTRSLIFPVTIKGLRYCVTVSKSLEETEDLLWLILWVTAGSVGVLVLGLFLGNRFLLRRIWHPFYATLEYLGNFSLSGRAVAPPGVSRIAEFALLSRSVEEMTGKMQKDYMALQQFTDHAAHEMQTPLAVIKGRIDLMMQEPGLGSRQLEQMQQLQRSVSRLNRLNQSLLLLTRIENRQFLEKESVALKPIIEEKIETMQDWIKAQQLTISLDLEEASLMMHPFLAESLVNNLMTNAVRHNVSGGSLVVELGAGYLRVANTGPSERLDEGRLFQRFMKQHPSEGVGLGLAIVKEIADLSGMGVSYTFESGRHTFTVTF